MKEFNLDEALKGNPVVLRNGNIAYIKYVIPHKFSVASGDKVLNGFMVYDECASTISWDSNGKYGYDDKASKHDIVGMYDNTFNVKRALDGEPVKLKNGLKAYIKYELHSDSSYNLMGYYIDDVTEFEYPVCWSNKGMINDLNNFFDIESMWVD